MFSIIAAIGKNNELGKNGKLVFRIREDMKFFREMTTGRKVVMGRKTWDSLPKKLAGRENIVISRHSFEGPDVIIHDTHEFIKKFRDSSEEIFVIGGGTVYKEFLPFAENLYLTEVDAADLDATTYFPEFDKSKYVKKIIKNGSENGLQYAICKYTRRS